MPPIDDIPQAARDVPVYSAGAEQHPWLRRTRLLRRFLGLAMLALAAGGLVAWYQTNGFSAVEFAQPFETMVNRSAVETDGAEPATSDRDVAVQLAPSSRTLLNHRAYDEAPDEELVTLNANAAIRLRAGAASQYEAMAQAARREGVRLVPLSGFRSQAEQETIFFSLKADRGQNAETRAEVSAPPGYSEHHTGYAIDIGDGNQAGANLNTDFADTRAYQWMEANAVRYGYELSFPPDNFQGVAFEPWHWRFVGDRASLETFYSE
ncbi:MULTISPECIES: M15 family metallopeptidase [Cyanophyceae]|uniref:M15 family metallopeptidase n=1 Tax=Cyanophyceae TaxID=3028117 RepID=UPI0016882085|nr:MULTISPECIES: M15 family metallopeptidase [Cyanophyceae]MBD1919074.1 D-alanyl-D-alanine carboxypeptidase family protein [Phormidium sp. FACHB-77]MBD2033075.1 D-alanyl-D-alanine carboxypeptidase family protein [Phormidium sp. FACHB-322]MBD2054003.1 D-alanyl-D-alanine carboxypeptidase family protein [Leptolyngbya sp. FACHB-60]